MNVASNCRLIGRWRIVETDLWDREYLDLCGPETLTITAEGGEIAFGAMEPGLEVEYAHDSIGFRWFGSDEGDQVEGEGSVELLEDGMIEIEFSYRNGDEAVLKAKRETSSTTGLGYQAERACFTSNAPEPRSLRCAQSSEFFRRSYLQLG